MSTDFSSHLCGNNLISLRPMFPIIKKTVDRFKP